MLRTTLNLKAFEEAIKKLKRLEDMEVIKRKMTRYFAEFMQGMKGPLYDAMVDEMPNTYPNRQLTKIIKGGGDPLVHTGELKKRANYKLVISETEPAAFFGILYGTAIGRSSGSSLFSDLASLSAWVQGARKSGGGYNLTKPRRHEYKVSKKMANLFKLLAGATKKRKKKKFTVGGKAPTGRLAELLKAVKGEEIKPLRENQIIIVRPRPYMLRAYMKIRQRTIEGMRGVLVKTISQTMKGGR